MVQLQLKSRLVAIAICIALLASTTPAMAAPTTVAANPNATLAQKQAEAQRVENEISLLDQQLEIIVEQYNAAHDLLVETEKKLKSAEVDFKDVQNRYDTQKQLFDIRLESLYRNSKFGGIEIVLGSKSFSDLFKRLEFIQKMADRDASILSEVSSQREQIEQVQTSLKQLNVQQAQLEKDLKVKQGSIQKQLAGRQAYLAKVNADIREILDTQEAQRNVDQAQLLASILGQTNSMGIIARPGSVVWDALKFVQLKVPYVWGGTTPRGFDCSGLCQYIYARHGVNLPRVSYQQAQAGQPVAANDVQAADLVFFGNPVHHVGIYIGGGYFVHAPRTGDVVKISKLSERLDYRFARRFPVRNPY